MKYQQLKNLLFCGTLALGLATAACGKKDEGGDKGGDKNTAAKGADKKGPAGDGPALDCPAFAKKMTECLEPFAEAYSKTEMGSKAGKNLDGTVDHALAAKNFKTLWGLKGEAMCTDEYSQRDPRWKERFAACDATAACDAWVPCMSTAMGELLPPL